MGAAILDPKIPYKLTFILPFIALLTKEPEVLQPDAFCEHTMQQNATAVGVRPGICLGSLHRWFYGGRFATGRGQKGGKGKGGEGKGKEGEGQGGRHRGGEGKGGEVDSDAQLEQGRRLAKAGPGETEREKCKFKKAGGVRHAVLASLVLCEAIKCIAAHKCAADSECKTPGIV